MTEDRREAKRFYCSRPWRSLRASILADHPLCVDCKAKGYLTEATEVHHIAKRRDRPDLALDQDNLMALCESCHSIRSKRGE